MPASRTTAKTKASKPTPESTGTRRRAVSSVNDAPATGPSRRKSEAQRKELKLQVRVTALDYERMEAAAAADRQDSVSSWARRILLERLDELPAKRSRSPRR